MTPDSRIDEVLRLSITMGSSKTLSVMRDVGFALCPGRVISTDPSPDAVNFRRVVGRLRALKAAGRIGITAASGWHIKGLNQ